MTVERALKATACVALAALLMGLIGLAGAPPGGALRGWWQGAAGDSYAFAETLVVAVPLALVGLGAVPSLRGGFLSVGAEGQLAVGALTSTLSLLTAPHLPQPLLWVLGATAGVAGGAAWALVPAWLRARRGVSEALTTLLMNYLGVALVAYILRIVPSSAGEVPTPRSDTLPVAAMLPNLWPGTRLHAGAVLVVAVAIGLAWWLRSGSALRHAVRGQNPRLGRILGLSESREAYRTLALAGGAAGLAGWIQVAGIQGTLYPSVGSGFGFLGLLAALVGGQRPLGIIAAAVLFGALLNGADGMQTESGVPAAIATVCQGVLLIVVALALAGKTTASDRP